MSSAIQGILQVHIYTQCNKAEILEHRITLQVIKTYMSDWKLAMQFMAPVAWHPQHGTHSMLRIVVNKFNNFEDSVVIHCYGLVRALYYELWRVLWEGLWETTSWQLYDAVYSCDIDLVKLVDMRFTLFRCDTS